MPSETSRISNRRSPAGKVKWTRSPRRLPRRVGVRFIDADDAVTLMAAAKLADGDGGAEADFLAGTAGGSDDLGGAEAVFEIGDALLEGAFPRGGAKGAGAFIAQGVELVAEAEGAVGGHPVRHADGEGGIGAGDDGAFGDLGIFADTSFAHGSGSRGCGAGVRLLRGAGHGRDGSRRGGIEAARMGVDHGSSPWIARRASDRRGLRGESGRGLTWRRGRKGRRGRCGGGFWRRARGTSCRCIRGRGRPTGRIS